MKKFLSLILALVFVLSCTAALAEDFPATVLTYNREREEINTVYEKAPERVIAAYQSNIEIMLKLGLADRIVCAFGLDEEITGELAEEFAKIPYYESRPSKEEAIALQPDAILGWRSLFADDRFGGVEYWIENGCNTYMSINSTLKSENGGNTIECEMQDILNIGAMFGKNAEAQAIVDEMYAEIERIGAYVTESGIEPLSVAVLEDEGDSYRVYGHSTLGGNIAERVGATLAVGAENSDNVGVEDLIAANPDKIFMIWYQGWLGPDEVVASIMENPALASLKAVQNGDVYALNLVQVWCSGLHTMEGIQTFASALYPELYA
ncbi:MAG: ABC transporter substrate-binding protein [Clostridia bacterium]|nr:ABC transporter substrate-binding protein [Clostridia bacterium]